jgi:hypothetical protein
MQPQAYFVPVMAPARGGLGAGRLAAWLFAGAALLMLAFSGLISYRWVQANLFHWGVSTSSTVEINQAQLLERVRAFELTTVKHTYASHGQIDVKKEFGAGPVGIGLPGWIAGQKLDVKGDVVVMAGVDLALVQPEDMEITQQGDGTLVVIRLPAARIMATEIKADTLDISTSAGVLTRLRTTIGLSEQDLRDRSAGQLTDVARESAIEQGILADAAREAEQRLAAFLQSLPQPAGTHVTYVVMARQAAQ